ncbi:MAG: hypothetical protein AVDCRST_MAG50-2952, partial [uncultured Acidimicrobiales bacterium]
GHRSSTRDAPHQLDRHHGGRVGRASARSWRRPSPPTSHPRVAGVGHRSGGRGHAVGRAPDDRSCASRGSVV